MPATRPPSLARASLLGLGAGMVLSAVVLGVLALGNATRECESPEPRECEYDAAIYGGVARLQALGALGCALVGAGAVVMLRSKRPTDAGGPPGDGPA